MKDYVFLSYSSKDYQNAQEVKRILNINHIDCWMDMQGGIQGGEDFTEEIPIAIENCSVFVVLLSENSQKSTFVKRELTLAIKKEKIVIPIDIEKINLTKSFDFLLSHSERINAYDNETLAMKTLVDRINAIIIDGDNDNKKDDIIDKDGGGNDNFANVCPNCYSNKVKFVTVNIKKHRTHQHILTAVLIASLVLDFIVCSIIGTGKSDVTGPSTIILLLLLLGEIGLIVLKIRSFFNFRSLQKNGSFMRCKKCGHEWKNS